MCGRFMLFDEAQNEELRSIIDELNRQFKEEIPTLKVGEIFPTDNVPIIALEGGKRTTRIAKWGFPSFKSNGVIINARSETLDEKPTFRKSFHEKRCLIPANGYYEWHRSGNAITKYLIRTENPIFYMAGLYNDFIDKNNMPYTGFVIITTEPNPAISRIHNRMPVILSPEGINIWLDSSDIENRKSLLAPYHNTVISSIA